MPQKCIIPGFSHNQFSCSKFWVYREKTTISYLDLWHVRRYSHNNATWNNRFLARKIRYNAYAGKFHFLHMVKNNFVFSYLIKSQFLRNYLESRDIQYNCLVFYYHILYVLFFFWYYKITDYLIVETELTYLVYNAAVQTCIIIDLWLFIQAQFTNSKFTGN